MAGGLTHSFYKAIRSDARSGLNKIKHFSHASVASVSTVSATIAGVTIGQLLLPVPFLGAFVGGMMGGFLGSKGSANVSEFLHKKNFNEVIGHLRFSIEQ